MDSHQKKLSLLLKKREKIENEMKLLLEKRNKVLLDILQDVPSPSLDPSVLVGGLLYVCEQAAINPDLAKQWRETGQKFRKLKANSKALQSAA